MRDAAQLAVVFFGRPSPGCNLRCVERGVQEALALHWGPGSESGGSLVELALVLPVLLLLLLGAADFGRAYFLGIEVSRAAYSGALYGSQNSSDTVGMQNAAVLDAPDVPGFTASNVTVTTGCECSDGTSASQGCAAPPTCAANQVTYIQVNTSLNYAVLFKYPGITTPLTLRGSARMRATQ